MIHERDSLRWSTRSQTCIFCHNTCSRGRRLLGAIAGPTRTATRASRSTAVSTIVATPRRARRRAGARKRGGRRYAPRGTNGPSSRRRPSRRTPSTSSGRGRRRRWSKRGSAARADGARSHAQDPRLVPAPVPGLVDGADALSPGQRRGREPGLRPNSAIIRFSRYYPSPGEGGRRDAAGGSKDINSGEARDFLLGGCARAMQVVRPCHDPHGGSDRARLDALATPVATASAPDAAPTKRPEKPASTPVARPLRAPGLVRRVPHVFARTCWPRRTSHPLPPHRVPHRLGARPRRPSCSRRVVPNTRDGARASIVDEMGEGMEAHQVPARTAHRGALLQPARRQCPARHPRPPG